MNTDELVNVNYESVKDAIKTVEHAVITGVVDAAVVISVKKNDDGPDAYAQGMFGMADHVSHALSEALAQFVSTVPGGAREHGEVFTYITDRVVHRLQQIHDAKHNQENDDADD